MKQIKLNRLNQLLKKCKNTKIAIVGDLMIDKYLWGNVERISPEAPVPVVDIYEESTHLGGAANVANNVSSLGGMPILFGVIGDDPSGRELMDLLRRQDFDNSGVIRDTKRATTLKTRIIADNQHVVRADYESVEEISEEVENQIFNLLQDKISELGGIVLEDYNKGVITASLIKKITSLANEHDCPVVVDPKFKNFFEYKNVTLFKPNLAETQSALGFGLDSPERINLAGRLLIERLDCENVLITLGSDGMALFTKDGKESKVQTKARKIHDVSGAGDTVIGTLIMILAAGGDVKEAASIANHAAGVVCGEVGIVPILPDKIVQSFNNDNSYE